MKKVTGSVRIGLVRRRSVSPEANHYELASSIPEQPDNHLIQQNSDLPSPPPSPHVVQQTATTDPHEIPFTSKWSTSRKTIVAIIASLLLVILIVVATVLGVLLTRSTETTTTPTVSSTIAPTIISAVWLFDNTTTDSNGVYNGVLVNGAQYSPISITQPYVGYGQALYVTSSSNQTFLVSTPFLDLSYKSFTNEVWIFVIGSIVTDRGIFTQCECSTCANQCLYLSIGASRLNGGFAINDVSGSTTLSANMWFHVAFVYNYQTQQQILYINGIQDAIKSNAQPYQGINGTIQVGSTQVYATTTYFNGYTDNLKLVTRAKSAAEILNDASLIAYYSFDLPSPGIDNGPNGLNGTLSNTVLVTGRINQAMRFTGSVSYFRVYGFYQTGYGVSSNKPFSISMWINPSSIIGCTFLEQTTIQGGGFCSYTFGIWSTGGSSGQLVTQGYGGSPIFGPFLTANSWTHISFTYSFTNGYSLYVKGVLFGTTGSTSSGSSGQLVWLYFGYGGSCFSTSYFSTTAYQGSLDEIYIHNRELTSAEVVALANP